MNEENDTTIYLVVMNSEAQYSIWPEWKMPIPAGWKIVGKRGLKAECLTHIKEAWVDMRPLSLRRRMAESVKTGDMIPLISRNWST